jgi:hypothetical protein
MGKIAGVLVLGLVITGVFFAVSGKESVGVTVDEARVFVETDDLDVEFTREDPVSETYMLFGGTPVQHGNAINKITLAGLEMSTAKKIHKRYPDFFKCASPGAAMAKPRVKQLDIVPADANVLATLQQALEEFNDNIRNGGDRICVKITGVRLELGKATVRELGEDLTPKLKQHKLNFLLVTSAEKLEAGPLLTD